MPAAADLLPAGLDLQPEFHGPVAHADRWLWISLVLLALVVLYYAVSWWVTRPPRLRDVARADVDVPDLQREHLARIDRVEADVRAGVLEPREGHQQLSEVMRSYVAEVTTLPARTMVLADFRLQAPPELVEALEVMYPPEFGPDGEMARGRFDDAVARAREVVSTWS